MATKQEREILIRIEVKQAVMDEKLDNLAKKLCGHLARHWAVELAVVMLVAGGLLKVFVWG